MVTHLGAAFIASVAIAFVLIQARPSRTTRTKWFGLVNLAAVWAIFGYRVALSLAVVSGLIWIVLTAYRRFAKVASPAALTVMLVAIYGTIAVAFGCYKYLLDIIGISTLAANAAATPVRFHFVSLLQMAAFAYLALRLVDTTRAVAAGAPLLDPISMSGYLMPFFMTPAGPTNVYVDHARMNAADEPELDWTLFISCMNQITSGLVLKYVLADGLRLFLVGTHGAWPTGTLSDTATIFFYIYLEFAGYSLVALGVGRLLNVPTPVNFRAPYRSQSLTEFWTRWHISLGDFVRRNLYFPLQVALVRRFSRSRAYWTNLIALWLPFVLVGLWHRVTMSFLLWGIMIGALVALEKVFQPRLLHFAARYPALPRIWLFLGPVYAVGTVILTLHFVMPDMLGVRR